MRSRARDVPSLAGVLVLSGGTSEEDLAVSPIVPDLVCADLAAFAGLA